MQHTILMYFHFTWHESSGFDIFFPLFSPFSISFFFSGFPLLVDSFRAAWHLRHRFHSYNIGDNLLYHLVAPEARVSFRFAEFELYGRLTFLASAHSRLVLYRLHRCRCLCISQDFLYSSSFQFTFRRQKYLRNAPDDVSLKIEKRVPFLVVSISSVIGNVNRLSFASSF